jgi:thiol-disulfide isomerase/thioredoxin
MSTLTATDLASNMARRALRLRSARFLPDENDLSRWQKCGMLCSSLLRPRLYYEDHSARSPGRGDGIEKSRKVLLKTLSRTDTYSLPSQVPIHDDATVIYWLGESDQQEPASSSTFVAPSDAKLIAGFPHPFSKRSLIPAADLAGKSAPELQLKSAEGKITPLSSFRGKAVFIEFWATWCGPGVDLMPELTGLYQETGNKGLAWIIVDSDEDSADARKFISDEDIPWPNYHDEDGGLGKAYQREAIPLGVLIDADGKVVFYQSGYEISDLRAAIAKLGTQFGSVTAAPAPSK